MRLLDLPEQAEEREPRSLRAELLRGSSPRSAPETYAFGEDAKPRARPA